MKMSKEQAKGSFVFKIKRKNNTFDTITSESISKISKDDTNVVLDQDSEDAPTILCILHRNYKVGAACYNFEERLLNIYEEVNDEGPLYLMSRKIYSECYPKYVITFRSTTEDFVKMLINITNGVTATGDLKSIPKNFFLCSLKEYGYDICKKVLNEHRVGSNVEHTSSETHEIYMHSMINFDNRLSVHAAGALIRYMERNWTYFNRQCELQIMQIHQISLKDHMYIDPNSFKSLQVFHRRPHDSCFMRGVGANSREGLSLFRMFSEHCKSKVGRNRLRNLLLSPTTNISELNNRLDFLEFVQMPNHRDFVNSLKDSFKNISDIGKCLGKVRNSLATNRDWYTLHQTILHSILIKEFCEPYRKQSVILQNLAESISGDLLGLEEALSSCWDFDAGAKRNIPVIKFGLDSALDAKKIKQQDLIRHLSTAAEFAANALPDFLDECEIIFLPEMGHLVAIKIWDPDCNPHCLDKYGYKYMFTVRNLIHYKTSLCVELDTQIGDLITDIIDHENRIVRRLIDVVMKHSLDIRAPIKIIALMDCLLSMAKVASQENYVRPKLTTDNVHEIIKCRHPLIEKISTHFEANDYFSGGKYTSFKIITGPNGSGKSMYLKQVAVNIYLAHVGCFVPATSATISIVSSIYSRMQASESASLRLSAFMIDISQATQAMSGSGPSSLVLMDEFGRGTTGDEGIAILVSVMNSYIRRPDGCPHVLVSTHFQKVTDFIPKSSIVSHLKMEHTKQDGHIYFPYRLTDGVSESFAIDIAEFLGLGDKIIQRAREYYNSIKTGAKLKPFTEKDQQGPKQISEFNAIQKF